MADDFTIERILCILIKVQWFLNGEQTPIEMASANGDAYRFTNPCIKSGQSGKYSCFAESEAGVATCVANVQVIGKQFQNMK